ncbi:hypothetical protein BO78DRAFT_200161 [Aspergillus sclerotiicarbonarius CBS 121057]|uniref:Uncharacterized protein n=1 Tax=Aspergillus sclerotiicarbonarius (strain CBS 121057 / IBT 28362) TaxID=1448318 RepID=A0A319DZJ6_ASPSB|nr:hypothetical protein BO78DRAFT_200161 [Aspergillus sclerotiicarbonarius CBS 121057]
MPFTPPPSHPSIGSRRSTRHPVENSGKRTLIGIFYLATSWHWAMAHEIRVPVGQGSGDSTLPVVRCPPALKRRQPGCQSLIESNELVRIAEGAINLHTISFGQILAYRKAALKMLSMDA